MAGGADNRAGLWLALGFAWRLGYSIAVPLVLFLLAGRWLDRQLNTSPWLLLTGLVFSFITTNVLMFHEALRVMREAGRENDKKTRSQAQIKNDTNDQH